MNQIELYGNIPPAKHAGYQETVVRFNVLGEPKRCDNLDYIPTDDEYNALREVFPWLISEAVKKKRIDDSLKENRQIEKEPPEKHINFSKLLDFAIVGCLVAEMLAAVGWVL